MNFVNYMQKQLSDVLKKLFVPEIPIFRLNLKFLNPENQNIEFSKKIFQAPLNGKRVAKVTVVPTRGDSDFFEVGHLAVESRVFIRF